MDNKIRIKKKVVFIVPGPFSSVKEMSKYEELSDYYEGTILSSSYENMLSVKRVGSFNVIFSRVLYNHYILFNVLFFMRCLVFAFGARIRRTPYDLVVTYDPLKTGIWGVVVAKLLKTKFAPEVNGVYTSQAEYMDNSNKPSVRLKRMIYPRIEAWVVKRADGIKVLFPTQLDPFQQIVTNKVIHCYCNYVPIGRFANLAVSERKELLFVGYPFKRKGVDILIHAFKMIASDFPEWRLKILGWYPDPKELQSCIDNHPQIYHHPPVPALDIPSHIAGCAIFVLPSRSEAMGRVLVETMAAGKPRIGSNIDGIPTVIDDGVDGLLFESENIRDLSDKLKRLIMDPALRKNLGDAGKKRAFNEHTKERYLINVVNFYSDIVR